MTTISFIVRLCIAPVVAWATFRFWIAFYRHVGEPMWRRVLLGPRPYESFNPRADRFLEGHRESVRVVSYIAAFVAAALVFIVQWASSAVETESPEGVADRRVKGLPLHGLMPPSLARVADLRPDLFWWAGAPESEGLTVVLRQLAPVPADLASVWRETGGGTAFESEEILCPTGPTEAADGVAERTAWHRSAGLPDGLTLFHEGLALSAFRRGERPYVVLGDGYSVLSSFATFEEWFREMLLSEYADRYDLAGAV